MSSKSFLKPLHIASVLIILSIPNPLDGKLPLWFLVYGIIFILCLIGSFINLLFVRGNSAHNFSNLTLALDTVLIATTVLLNVSSIVITFTTKRKKGKKFYAFIKSVDALLNITNSYFRAKRKRAFLFEFFGFHVMYFTYCSYDFYTRYLIYSGLHLRFIPLIYIHQYMIFITVFQIYNCTLSLKERFNILNKNLINSIKTYATTRNMIFSNEVDFNYSLKIKKLMESHSKICDCVCLINESYGLQLFGIFIVTALCIIQNFNYAVILFSNDEYNPSKSFHGKFLILHSLTSIKFLVRNLILSQTYSKSANYRYLLWS